MSKWPSLHFRGYQAARASPDYIFLPVGNPLAPARRHMIAWKAYCEIPALATVLLASLHESIRRKWLFESPVFVGM
jgi:hypothetical protein